MTEDIYIIINKWTINHFKLSTAYIQSTSMPIYRRVPSDYCTILFSHIRLIGCQIILMVCRTGKRELKEKVQNTYFGVPGRKILLVVVEPG